MCFYHKICHNIYDKQEIKLSKEFVLGVDLDGVVADYEAGFRDFIAMKKNVSIDSIPTATHWSFTESGWPIKDEAEYLNLHREAVTKEHLFANIQPIPGASEALWALSDAGIRIRIVTHRLVVNFSHASAITDTVSFLDRHNIPYRDLCFVKDKAEVGTDLIVDDAPHNIKNLRKARGDESAMIFHQLYNKDLAGLRAYSWSDVVAEVVKRTGIEIDIQYRS
jgi:5'-nucleotidase